MKYFTILLIALLSLASSCQKEDIPPTDGHKNIFRCKVNGVEWTPHCISDFFGCSAIDCQYYVENGDLDISVIQRYEDNSSDEYIGLDANSILLGENDLSQSSGYEYADILKIYPCGYFDMDTTLTHSIIIFEIDTLNSRIVGSFEFTAYDRNGSCIDTVNITDGYFDVEFRF